MSSCGVIGVVYTTDLEYRAHVDHGVVALGRRIDITYVKDLGSAITAELKIGTGGSHHVGYLCIIDGVDQTGHCVVGRCWHRYQDVVDAYGVAWGQGRIGRLAGCYTVSLGLVDFTFRHARLLNSSDQAIQRSTNVHTTVVGADVQALAKSGSVNTLVGNDLLYKLELIGGYFQGVSHGQHQRTDQHYVATYLGVLTIRALCCAE